MREKRGLQHNLWVPAKDLGLRLWSAGTPPPPSSSSQPRLWARADADDDGAGGFSATAGWENHAKAPMHSEPNTNSPTGQTASDPLGEQTRD